jgi:hypothetical protein
MCRWWCVWPNFVGSQNLVKSLFSSNEMEDFLIRNFSRGIHAMDPTEIPAVISVDDLGSNVSRKSEIGVA